MSISLKSMIRQEKLFDTYLIALDMYQNGNIVGAKKLLRNKPMYVQMWFYSDIIEKEFGLTIKLIRKNKNMIVIRPKITDIDKYFSDKKGKVVSIYKEVLPIEIINDYSKVCNTLKTELKEILEHKRNVDYINWFMDIIYN